MQRILFLIIASVLLFGCRQPKRKVVQMPPKTNVVMKIASGTKAPAAPVDTLPGQNEVTVTAQCFGAEVDTSLYMLPRNIREARRDTTILSRINNREIYVLQPGEKGYVLARTGNRLQVRFPDKIVWVMASCTK